MILLYGIITARLSEILFINTSDSSSPEGVPQNTVTFGVMSPGGRKGKLVDFSFHTYEFIGY